MRVLIVRHGEAVDPYQANRDGDRWLTEGGRRTVRMVGDWLIDAGLVFDRMYTSPLVRAAQTSEILAERLGFDGPLAVWPELAGGTTAGALSVLDEVEPHETVALVGHEPLARAMVANLIRGSFPGFRTAAACLVDVTDKAGAFVWMLDPRTGERVTRLEGLIP
jgi:phosphohistidine phosphatase